MQPSNDGADIEATIGASRAKLRALDAGGARELLQAKIAEGEEARTRRLLPLLRERAEVERLTFDYEAAKATLAEITISLRTMHGLGSNSATCGGRRADRRMRQAPIEAPRRRRAAPARSATCRSAMRGSATCWWRRAICAEALRAYRDGARDRETGWRSRPRQRRLAARPVGVSHDKIGDVLVAQGKLRRGAEGLPRRPRDRASGWRRPTPATPAGSAICRYPTTRSATCWWRRAICAEALAAYRDGLAITRAAGRGGPGNAGWQRDLSVSPTTRSATCWWRRAICAEALKAYRDGLAIAERLAQADPGNADWQRDLSVAYDKIGDVLVAQGNLPEALKAYRDEPGDHASGWPQADPGNAGWQRDLSVSLRADRRRAGGAGQSAPRR